jgi:3-oxoacyl-ACP reductase-like protein
LDFNFSVERVEALDEASSIEPAQRNKTMTRALAYGTRDSVIAWQASINNRKHGPEIEEKAMTASSTNANHASEFGGKRVLVTGGTKGAGKAIASRFLQGDATVVITARSGPAEKTAAHFIQADLSTSEGTAHVIHEMLSRFSGTECLGSAAKSFQKCSK